MKKKIYYLINFLLLSGLMLAQGTRGGNGNSGDNLSSGVVLQFISESGYSNNLYIDNVVVGKQYNFDVSVLSINNIPSDTSYALGSTAIQVMPNVTIANVGLDNVTSPFNVTMTVNPGGYSSTKEASPFNSGQTQSLTFDELTITPGQQLDIEITTELPGDENSSNDVLNQNTVVFAGVQRNILLEEWTSSTCGPCASNNPTIDAFVQAKWDSIVAVKYHVGWPSPGNDPMYLYNPTQSYDRRYYYGVNGVPHVIMDGIVNPSYPYSTPSSLPNAFNSRINDGSPISVEVTDTRITADSIKTDVAVTVHAPLVQGDYYLRVHAVERRIDYPSPPGSNGEKTFFDVFRKAYPNSEGTVLPTSMGNYIFSFTYPIDRATWVDSMIYTIAFVQNDLTKEVLNCGKGREHLGESVDFVLNDNATSGRRISAVDDMIYGDPQLFINPSTEMMGGFNYELFEGAFPASGWSLMNPDGGLTFEQFTGANGPSFSGSKSVKVDFYNYSTVGATDTLYSKTYIGLDGNDSVKFDYAHAEYPNFGPDRLIVNLSIDGGVTFPFNIFDKSGNDLATVPATSSSFTPANANQWETFIYPLDAVVPVELTSFRAEVSGNEVNLFWSTASETNNQGFEIQRKSDGEFRVIGFIEGKGTITETTNYSFTDADLSAGSYTYRLKQVDFDGSYEFSNETQVEVAGPLSFNIEQNYPNPFNPATIIQYSVPEKRHVTIKIFDATGQQVGTLVDKSHDAGNYKISFDASSLASGVYIYRMISGDFVSAKKMSLIK